MLGTNVMAPYRDKSLHVVEKFPEDVTSDDQLIGSKAFVSFKLSEHLYDPSAFLGYLMELMNSGDFFNFTSLSGTGVNIQAP